MRLPQSKWVWLLALLAGCEPGRITPGTSKLPIAVPPTVSASLRVLYPAVAPAQYLTKIKTFLVSLPPTASEVAAVQSDPNALPGLIAQWMTTPQYQTNMLQFFETTFQQNMASYNDYQTLGNPDLYPYRAQNMQESFARTVLAMVNQGRPFRDVFTTQQFMMTPALMTWYAMYDALNHADNGQFIDLTVANNPNFSFTVETSQGMIPLADTLNPNSASYMTWYNPNITSTYYGYMGCPSGTDPLIVNSFNTEPGPETALTRSLMGILIGTDVLYRTKTNNMLCRAGVNQSAYLSTSDTTEWKMVTIRQPHPGEATTRFYDLVTMRNSNELILHIPRVSFFSTPAYLAHWNTNTSNQARVTTNQTLITALGKAFDGSTAATPGMDLRALDTAHAQPNTACYACHQTLDPMRQIFRHDYTLWFSAQQDPNNLALPGWFDFAGVSAPVSSVYELGSYLAHHPLLPAAWTQKLCTAVNSAPCDVNDPEFGRIASDFAASMSWNDLVVAVLSAQLTTHAQPTYVPAPPAAPPQPEIISITRQYALCAKLSAQFAIADICGLNVNTPATTLNNALRALAPALPAETYSRGATAPSLLTEPGLMYRATVDNVCAVVANQVVDGTGSTSFYNSQNPNAAIDQIVHTFLGLTPGNDAFLIQLFSKHFSDAIAQGASPSDALRSVFMLACVSPYFTGVGINN